MCPDLSFGVSRLDLYSDVGGWSLSADIRTRFVCRATPTKECAPTTIQWGNGVERNLHSVRGAGIGLSRPAPYGQHVAASTGASTKELMAGMGHASPRAALIYQHATAERDRAIAEALSELTLAEERAPRARVTKVPNVLSTGPVQSTLALTRETGERATGIEPA